MPPAAIASSEPVAISSTSGAQRVGVAVPAARSRSNVIVIAWGNFGAPTEPAEAGIELLLEALDRPVEDRRA